jgi:DegV family protein with EDD domain
LTVRIVTDSTSDLPPQVASELGVSVVPLSVIFGDEVYKEGVEIGHDLFYDKLVTSKAHPTTSAPSVGDFLAAYETLLKETKEIISIHLASKLSATYDVACQAARQMTEKGARIEVIDSNLISLGLTFVVAAAARAARSGASAKEIRALVERTIPRVHLFVALDTLEYVRRGGRIGRARAFLGAVLKVKPILSLRDGELHPEERVRTRALAIERLFQIATSYPRIEEVAVAYTTNPQDAEMMKRRIEAALPDARTQLTRLGPVLGVHGGPGVLGVGVLEGDQ